MDATHNKTLFIWIHGAPYQAPEIYTIAAPMMSLAEFRDRYVDTSRDHLIIRVEQACDQPTRVDQEFQGQPYRVQLAPMEGEVASAWDSAPGSTAQATAEIGLTAIRGIGQGYAALLRKKAKIDSAQDLLAAGATPLGRQKLQSQTKLGPKLILKWIQQADLMRIEGIGPDASQLLWNAGVTSVPNLAIQSPKTLLQKLSRIQKQQGGAHRPPNLKQVTDWIRQASKMESKVVL
jgi:predicted flap endonuclease-1-like 5' DNA nuclease